MESFFQSNPITHPVSKGDRTPKDPSASSASSASSSASKDGDGVADKTPKKNEKKPLNRQNSSWYNMSFLDCGYTRNKAPPTGAAWLLGALLPPPPPTFLPFFVSVKVSFHLIKVNSS